MYIIYTYNIVYIDFVLYIQTERITERSRPIITERDRHRLIRILYVFLFGVACVIITIRNLIYIIYIARTE